MKALLPPYFFLLIALLMGLVCWFFGMTHYLAFPLNLTGLPLLSGGILLAQSGKNLLRRNKTNVETFDLPDTLITSGLYRVSRNPMYLGLLIALLGVAILYQGGLTSFILVLLFFLVVNGWYIRYEEKMMQATFGQRYQDYCATTRRWI